MVFVSASYLILKGLGFGKEFSCLLWFKLWRKCSMNWRKAAVLEFWITLKREKYSENVPRKFVCNSSPEVMPPIFFSREPEWEIQHFCPPLRLPCSLILFLALTVPPLASPPKTYAIIAERCIIHSQLLKTWCCFSDMWFTVSWQCLCQPLGFQQGWWKYRELGWETMLLWACLNEAPPTVISFINSFFTDPKWSA